MWIVDTGDGKGGGGGQCAVSFVGSEYICIFAGRGGTHAAVLRPTAMV
jgi:hypothetical protein